MSSEGQVNPVELLIMTNNVSVFDMSSTFNPILTSHATIKMVYDGHVVIILCDLETRGSIQWYIIVFYFPYFFQTCFIIFLHSNVIFVIQQTNKFYCRPSFDSTSLPSKTKLQGCGTVYTQKCL